MPLQPNVNWLNVPASQTTAAADATIGGQFFWGEGNCGSCHMVHGEGASKGPDLSDVGTRLTAQEINSVLSHPDQHITTGYGLVTVTLRNGKTVRGFAEGEQILVCNCRILMGPFTHCSLTT
jgi:quinoprotein glucose dehydrogenase